jgi:uncharacterized protein YuzE
MKVNFDREADALYVRFSEAAIAETSEVRPGVMLDYDAQGKLVAIEILSTGQTLAGADLHKLALEVA